MAFKEFIFNHFPHRWLNIKKDGVKRLFTGLGNVFDEIEAYVQIPVTNNSTRSALEALPELENEYGLNIDPSVDIEIRRAKIIMKKRMIDCPITMPVLESIFEAVGVLVHITNKYNYSIMIFTVITNKYSLSVSDILYVLYENIRAHVALEIEIPENIEAEFYVGVHIDTNYGYSFDFLSFDNEYEIYTHVYSGNVLSAEGGYNFTWEV